jgi:SPP1 gp7 family putative phage head morphogenesis protein
MPIPADPRGRELYLMVSRDAYERWLAREVESLLRNGYNDVVTSLVTRYNDLTPAQRTRQLQLYGQIDRFLSDAYGTANKFTKKQFDDYAAIESEVTRAQLRAIVAQGDITLTFDAMSKAEIRNIAALPIAGLDLGDWWDKQASDMSTETRRQIQMGLLGGETPQQIVRRIMPSDVTSPAVLRAARRNASTLVRTTVTTVHNNAALETMIAAGPKVTTSYRYIAVRDARTSKICQALSNKVFEFTDEKKKMPPQHPNCRSTIVAEINYAKIGLPTPATTSPLSFQSYDAWLQEQSSDMQSVILGASRQSLYASGRVTLQEMVATDNRTLTLDQLRSRLTS